MAQKQGVSASNVFWAGDNVIVNVEEERMTDEGARDPTAHASFENTVEGATLSAEEVVDPWETAADPRAWRNEDVEGG